MTQLDFLDGRKSVRTFDPTAQISNQEIMDILSHAANAPSGNNFQNFIPRISVTKGSDLITDFLP